MKGRGVWTGELGPKESLRPDRDPTSEPPVIDVFDRDLVRRVVHAHRAQVRYCYERELQHLPNLAGKVGVRFVISADGSVRSVDVDHSTLNNPAVERCLMSRIAEWTFPKPKAGGIVVVTYPFLFRSTGD